MSFEIPLNQRKLALVYAKLDVDNFFGEKNPNVANQLHNPEGQFLDASISKNQLKKWRDTGNAAPKATLLQICNSIKYVNDSYSSKMGLTPLTDNAISPVQFGTFLGFSKSFSRFLVDDLYARLTPSFMMFAPTHTEARDLVIEHAGLYTIYRLEVYGSKWAVTQIPMSIRYPLKSDKRLSDSHRRIRCKLLIPRYVTSQNKNKHVPIKYDGYFTSLGGSMFFTLEMRNPSTLDQQNHRDTISMITTQHSPKQEIEDVIADPSRAFVGHMLTSSQRGKRGQSFPSPIVIVKDPNYSSIHLPNSRKGFYDIYQHNSIKDPLSKKYLEELAPTERFDEQAVLEQLTQSTNDFETDFFSTQCLHAETGQNVPSNVLKILFENADPYQQLFISKALMSERERFF